MRNCVFLIAITTLLLSCSTNKTSKVASGRNIDEELFVEEFKLKYFESCLKNGFNNSEDIQRLLSFDKSGYGDPILGTDYLYLDIVAQQTALKMRTDSINSITGSAEGTHGKKVISTCLKDYNGKWLDTMARAHYKKLE